MTEEQTQPVVCGACALRAGEKVHDNLVKRIKTEEMGDYIYEVVLPTERVSEIKRGKKTETTRKFFPGYLIVNMWLLDEKQAARRQDLVFHQGNPGVIGFAGTKDRPIPMRPSEVEGCSRRCAARRQSQTEDQLRVGEMVKVADGPFQNQSGVVEEIDPERGKLRVSVSIFGRATPVD